MSIWDFNLFDWLLIAILAWSTISGFFKGLLRAVFSLVAIAAGIVVASWNYNAIADLIGRWVTPRPIAQIVSFLAIALALMVALPMAGAALRRMAEKAGLGGADELLGGVFGFVRGVLVGVMLLMAMSAFTPDVDWVSESKLTPYFLAGAHEVSFVVPDDLKVRIANGAYRLNYHTPIWINRPRAN